MLSADRQWKNKACLSRGQLTFGTAMESIGIPFFCMAKINANEASESIKSARELLSTQQAFLSHIKRRAPAEVDHPSITELSNLEQIVEEVKADVDSEKRTWVTNRTKASQHVQDFATKFSRFLESYSGIVEVLKGVDQQYGGAAYGTLSIFLIVRWR